ncbi:MAG: hypothetical protein ACE5FW_00275, partial [Candidatus Aenigmatarchaeota archaeon]
MSSKRRYRTHAVILAAVLCLAGVFTLSYLAETGLVLEPANLTNATYTNETAPANETTEPLPDETFNETGETANGTAPEQPPEAPAPEPSTEEVLEPPTEPSFPETPAIPETQTSPSLAANYSVGTITINGTGNNCSTVNASINNASVFFWNGTTAWANAHIALDGNWTLDCGTLVMNESSDDQYVFDINSGGNLSFNTNQNIDSNGYAFDIDLNSGGIIDWHADLDMSNTGAGDYVMTLDGSNLQIDCNSNKLISSS